LTQRPFAIQVKALNNSADAGNLIAELKKKGVDVYSVAASIGTRGIWHRVLIGRFKDQREAVKFMQEHKIRDSYPDSFIRKLPL
jgi:cell division septation protein DedD